QSAHALGDAPSFPTRRSSDLTGRGQCCYQQGLQDKCLGGALAGSEPPRHQRSRNCTVHQALRGLLTRQWLNCFSTLVLEALPARSEEHTSELQSRGHIVSRPL